MTREQIASGLYVYCSGCGKVFDAYKEKEYDVCPLCNRRSCLSGVFRRGAGPLGLRDEDYPEVEENQQMTRDDILKLDAGPELDRLVAEKVMGWRTKAGVEYPEWVLSFDDKSGRTECIRGPKGDTCGCWMPSTNIAAAWEVVEKMCERHHWTMHTPFTADGPLMFAGLTPLGITGWNGHPDIVAQGSTMPLAICRAALLSALEAE